MCREKTPSVAYCTRLLITVTRTELISLIAEAPLSEIEKEILIDIHARRTLKELAVKYGLTVSGIAQKKRSIYNRLHRFDICRLRR